VEIRAQLLPASSGLACWDEKQRSAQKKFLCRIFQLAATGGRWLSITVFSRGYMAAQHSI